MIQATQPHVLRRLLRARPSKDASLTATMGLLRIDEQDVIGLLRDYTARREREPRRIAQADGHP